LEAGISDYGKRRLGEVIEALAVFDASPDDGARAAARWLERLEVPQNPGAAAVQVMTIHKSKGLGFDVVFLPMLPDRRIPETQRFKVAEGEGWLTELPPAWARAFFPEIREAEGKWAGDQAYEALCQLYVALTRAKRGLYVYLAKKGKSPSTDAPTLTNWLLNALGADASPGLVFQCGDPHWSESLALRMTPESHENAVQLGRPEPRRQRMRPSAHEPADEPARSVATPNPSGMEFGSEVHACFEVIHWREDFNPATLPNTDAGRLVASLMNEEAIATIFTKPENHVTLHREQMVDAILGKRWLSGIIDRMHVHRDAPGEPVNRVEIIDFKSDAVDDPEVLLDRHAGQMRAYGQVMATLYPAAKIELTLVSTALRRVVTIE
jgi:ATP-dependent exoDNAse (exonuclease V) beta subunit